MTKTDRSHQIEATQALMNKVTAVQNVRIAEYAATAEPPTRTTAPPHPAPSTG